MCADAPNTDGMNEAARANAEVAKEALAFYKQAYADQAPMRDKAAQTALEVSQQQLASSKLNDTISKDYWDYQKNTFRPLEEGIVADAQQYDTPERREQAAQAAAATMGTTMANTREAAAMRNASMGVNPNSGRAAALDQQTGVAEAAATADAMNGARDKVELQGYARKMDAANLGRGLASSQATSAQVALSGGTSAANTAAMPVQQAQSATAMAGQGFTTAIAGFDSAGSIYGKEASIQGQYGGSDLIGGLGTMAGAAAGLGWSPFKKGG